jgi:hypothetical protein
MKRNTRSRVRTGSPTLDYVIKLGIPREQWAAEWLKLAYGRIPDSISAEELAEVVPSELAEEIDPRSLSSLRTVCLATPVMRHVALMEVPSTKAAITWERFSVERQFIMNQCYTCSGMNSGNC